MLIPSVPHTYVMGQTHYHYQASGINVFAVALKLGICKALLTRGRVHIFRNRRRFCSVLNSAVDD